ncbi:hypothetical protein GIV19_24120 [Pseudomonas syringae]|jgi:hypothetical protein|uniref:hypothetical protein n=1 Tax=Pseudomonas syringae TaxID=317 RepID=UPI001F1DDDFB|nr:hypothetical protein [Pseudomonas syringae]MCF5710339.1 hypothetical protein [Pseudomonas syringae]
MTNTINFQSQAQLKNQAQLEAYIHHAKNVSTVWKDLPGFDWDADAWDTPRGGLRFIKHGVKMHKSALPTPEQRFEGVFMDFAKAYIVNTRQGAHGKLFRHEYTALQHLEAAMIQLDGFADITTLSTRHLDKAVEIIKKKDKGHLNAGIALQNLARLVATQDISSNSLKYWEHPFRGRAFIDSLEVAKTKLPEDEALLSLAEIFSNGYVGELDDEAVYVTSLTAMLLSAPMRINDHRWFRLNALKSDTDKEGKEQFYLHYFSTKNKRMATKGVPAVMAGHCQEAFRRVREMTEEGRRLAKHYESGSPSFYPHEGLPDVPPDQILTRGEVEAALGRPSRKSAENLMKHMQGHHKLAGWTLTTLWAVVREYNMKMNPFFPYQVDPKLYAATPPKMSESLFCIRESQLAERHASSPIFLAPVNHDYYTKRLAMDKVSTVNGKTYESFLTRHGYRDIALRSHQLRHFLNTAAQEAGVGIDRITDWSTRASVQQSRGYMHQDPARAARRLGDALIPVVEVVPVPVTAADYDIRDKGPMITTRYGICSHPWTIDPCQKSADCLNCSELVHCKGHKRSLAAVERERDMVAENLEATLKAIEAGNRPATRWVETHTRYLERLNTIVGMHKDPSIPDGSPVQMAGKDFTHAKRVMATKHPEAIARDTLSIEYSDELMSCLQRLMDSE